ncbi:hypothetical protein MAPG_09551 [Magnaporthiopsis poae ATCC 64411]|uniref:Uncharacterized protein n=1 Tax=Magnaporthiopsis poae (strain ATCC 64411 / 73-15) TaxID=644358 RepID=A0A0C4EA92_MAGP6|nr:hypothetical protein MAPG_09551 [Magnaporthiopsis poae ATCC 64411]
MQFFNVLSILAAVGVVAANPIEARADCSRGMPSCFGGHIVGQVDCPCNYQKGPCDRWTCPDEKRWMACGQERTACVWI